MDLEIPKPIIYQNHILSNTRIAMEEIAAKMLFLKKRKIRNKSNPKNESKSEHKELITDMSLLFLTLRQVNRAILLEEDEVKAETENAKALVESMTLELQNLMYEKSCYVKAIKSCNDFKSKYSDVDIVAEEEFFNNAPGDIKGKAMSTDKDCNLMLKRLSFELFQRKELGKHHEELELQKRHLLETIADREKIISSLSSQLKSLKKAVLPVQQQFGNTDTKKLQQHNAAELLPPPLYNIYVKLLAQKETFDERIEVDIVGSLKDAQKCALQRANDDSGTKINNNSMLVETAPDDREADQRRRKRHKKSVVEDNIQIGTYHMHPLRVILFIYDDKDYEAKPSKLITLRFEYLENLNIICVGVEDTEEKCDTNILRNLFPDDNGMELPHQIAKLCAGDAAYINEDATSRPYIWAQYLGGIDILQELPPLHGCIGTLNSRNLKGGCNHIRVQTIVQKIRSMKKAQMAPQ